MLHTSGEVKNQAEAVARPAVETPPCHAAAPATARPTFCFARCWPRGSPDSTLIRWPRLQNLIKESRDRSVGLDF
jgi:hypothetical protein